MNNNILFVLLCLCLLVLVSFYHVTWNGIWQNCSDKILDLHIYVSFDIVHLHCTQVICYCTFLFFRIRNILLCQRTFCHHIQKKTTSEQNQMHLTLNFLYLNMKALPMLLLVFQNIPMRVTLTSRLQY